MAQVTGLESVQREFAKLYTENQNEVHGRKLNGAMSYSTQAHLGRKNEFEQRETDDIDCVLHGDRHISS